MIDTSQIVRKSDWSNKHPPRLEHCRPGVLNSSSVSRMRVGMEAVGVGLRICTVFLILSVVCGQDANDQDVCMEEQGSFQASGREIKIATRTWRASGSSRPPKALVMNEPGVLGAYKKFWKNKIKRLSAGLYQSHPTHIAWFRRRRS